MELGERKRKILQAIIDDYITTADPVGSRTIAKKHDLGLSSATIRNEMADLEEMGYLEQPHTSAGRIPSDLGYRLYVDHLMRRYKLTVAEVKKMQHALELRIQELDRLIQQYSNIVSQFTQYTTVVLPPQMKKSAIKHIQLVPIDTNNVLLIMVTDAGIVKNKTLKIYEQVSHDFLNSLSRILNDKLSGLTLEEINLPKIQEIQKEMRSNEGLLIPILNIISDIITDIDDMDVFLGGTTNIFNFPEYKDIERAKEFLSFLEQKKDLYKLLSSVKDNDNISIVIGRENEFMEMRDCSIIMSKYSIGKKIVGTIGIIGPTRMEYAKVVSSLEYLTWHLNHVLVQLFGEEPEDDS